MRSSTIKRVQAGLALLLAASALRAAAPAGSLLHKPAPEFVRMDVNQRRVDLAQFRGSVVLLTFWATWCAPCQLEMPRFIDWQNRYAAQGFQVVAISMDDDQAPVIALTRKRHVNFPVIMGDEELGRLYGGILGLPVTFLIDRHGNIAARFKGEANLNAMKSTISELLSAR